MEQTDPKPSIIVIFGITGDLAQRYLLPAIYHLFKDGLLDEQTVILGITRRDVSVEELLGRVELCVNEIDKVCDPAALKKVQGALRMHQMSLTDPAAYRGLLELMNGIEDEKGICMNRLYYLSIPPQMFEPIVRNLGEQGLNKSCRHGRADTRLMIEKPFGYDLASARELIDETAAWFSEDQMFRIDHYLAKPMVQEVLPLRFNNRTVEDIWNSRFVSSIEIAAFEKLDIEGRAIFYEEVGALRDFIQSHLLQILGIVTMDLPDALESSAIHEKRLPALQAIQPITVRDVAAKTVRGQYVGYRDEVKNPDSLTETYAAIHPAISAERWQGVTVTLLTGKAMAERHAYIRLVFKDGAGEITFHIQPDPRIEVAVGTNPPDFIAHLSGLADAINKSFTGKTTRPDAYERVLIDAARGDHTLFTTGDEVIAAWKAADDILGVWSRSSDGLIFYPKGSAAVKR